MLNLPEEDLIPNRKNEFPLFPRLDDEGVKHAEELIEAFKKKMFKVCEETMSDFYIDIVAHIESDAWTNFRNDLMDGLQNYNNRHIQGKYDFEKIRKKIYEEYKDELIKDMNQDLVDKVAELKADLKREREFRRMYS